MRRFNSILIGMMICGAGVITGCSNQTTVDDLREAYRVQQQRNAELESENESYRTSNEALRNQLSRADQKIRDTDARRREAADAMQKAMDEYASLEDRLNSLDPVALPLDLDAALEKLANSNPELMAYDSKRGMIQFLSDLTFDLGSAEVKSGATETLSNLAKVLNSSSATNYDIRIVGHTDNVPIKNVGTRAKHPTNLYLSVHRAIAVRDALVNAGVGESRFCVAGWGEYRPLVENPAKGGARANRRVEIFLVPATNSGTIASPKSPTTPEENRSGIVDADEPMK